MKHLCLLALLVISFSCDTKEINLDHGNEPYVILVSFDGFRHDYVEKYGLPNFKQMIAEGASVEALIPSFPSKTFPNHYTLVTGLYPGHHGLVDNSFYDRHKKVIYAMRKRNLVEDPYFYGGIPLWQWLQSNGMKSASYFWIGSEAKVAGEYPSYYHYYDGGVGNETRIKAVIDWLQLPPGDRPRFITLYFSLVDSEGHHSGPDSNALKKTLLEADRLLGSLLKKVSSLPFRTNVLVSSDHGMLGMKREEGTLLFVDKILDWVPGNVRIISNGSHVHLYVNDDSNKQTIYTKLKAQESYFETYLKEETPKKWHYRAHERIGDILLVAQPGHYFKKDEQALKLDGGSFGEHGFDPYSTPEMGGIFYAWGPNIVKGIHLEACENVHIFPLVTKILGVDNPEIDGDPSVLEPMYQP